MPRDLTVKLHAVAEDGLPDTKVDQDLVCRIALFFDGNVVSGWPLDPESLRPAHEGYGQLWEGDSDVSHGRPFANVTHWIEFPKPIWELVKEGE